MTSTQNQPTLRCENAGKRYRDWVLRGVDLQLEGGKIYGVVGENGAGKSTLLSLLAGVRPPDEGAVFVGGEPLRGGVPQARRAGIGLVYQHFSLVDDFTCLESLMLGEEPCDSLGRLTPEPLAKRAKAVLERTGYSLPLDAKVGSLSIAQKQQLEIIRVLLRGADILLLDEPTAVLLPSEVEELFALLKELSAEGKLVLVVTHHLDEVISHCDEAAIFRKGELVWKGPVAETSQPALAEMALGAQVKPVKAAGAPQDGPPVLELKGLQVPRSPGAHESIEALDLALRPGEIVGIAGVAGNGQDALVGALVGTRAISAGAIILAGKNVSQAPVGQRRAEGLEAIFADRHQDGAIIDASVSDNLILGEGLTREAEAQAIERRVQMANATPSDPALPLGALSGGNQQKIVASRAFDRKPKVLVAAYPTRGIDARAAEDVRKRLAELAEGGAAILLISSEWEELRGLCQSIEVLYRGKHQGSFAPDAPEKDLALAMLGGGAHDGH